MQKVGQTYSKLSKYIFTFLFCFVLFCFVYWHSCNTIYYNHDCSEDDEMNMLSCICLSEFKVVMLSCVQHSEPFLNIVKKISHVTHDRTFLDDERPIFSSCWVNIAICWGERQITIRNLQKGDPGLEEKGNTQWCIYLIPMIKTERLERSFLNNNSKIHG
jgi:hypothetical protein